MDMSHAFKLFCVDMEIQSINARTFEFSLWSLVAMTCPDYSKRVITNCLLPSVLQLPVPLDLYETAVDVLCVVSVCIANDLPLCSPRH